MGCNLNNFRFTQNDVPPRSKLMKVLENTYKTGTRPEAIGRVLTKYEVPFNENYNLSLPFLEQELNQGKFALVVYQSVRYADVTAPDGNSIEWHEDKVNPDDLINLEWGHYVIIVGQTQKTFMAIDPAMDYPLKGLPVGIREIPKKLFNERWIDVETNGDMANQWALIFQPKI